MPSEAKHNLKNNAVKIGFCFMGPISGQALEQQSLGLSALAAITPLPALGHIRSWSYDAVMATDTSCLPGGRH
jgi:hypothetical protein